MHRAAKILIHCALPALLITLHAPARTQTPPSPEPGLPGSGLVTGETSPRTNDVVVALRILVGLVDPAPGQVLALDVNADGRLGISDAARLLRAVVGLEKLSPRPLPPAGDRTSFGLMSAWYDDHEVRFIATDDSDPKAAAAMKINYAPALAKVAGSSAVRPIYTFFTEQNGVLVPVPDQRPVFAATVLEEDYTPLWQVHQVVVSPEYKPNSLKKDDDITEDKGTGKGGVVVRVVPTNEVLDGPVLFDPAAGEDPPHPPYATPQAFFGADGKTVSLPHENVLYDGEIYHMIGPDTADPEDAVMHHGNLAPALAGSEAAAIPFYLVTDSNGPTQPPVLSAAPEPLGPDNKEDAYSPVWRLIRVKWKGSVVGPPRLNSDDDVKNRLESGDLEQLPGGFLFNCPVVGEEGEAEAEGPSPVIEPAIPLSLRLVAEDLTSPVALMTAPEGSGRLFIVDQAGSIRLVMPDGKPAAEPFLDLTGKIVPLKPEYDERGLLGLAFHPGYGTNGRLFVFYTTPLRSGGPAGWDSTMTLLEFHVSAGDPNRADPASERVILQIDKPQFNHNGGTIAFGPDGFLYLSIGDGGGANDTGTGHTPALGNAQDTTRLLGKILRIDVDQGAPYGIPADNPFASGQGGLPEIFAYGLRNPYRFSFDRGGGHELFLSDAGQDLWEEADIIQKGGNYGWHIMEGTHCFDPDNPKQSPADCPDAGASGEPLIDPVIEFANAHQPGGLGHVIVGGYVYRGSALPDLAGHYLYGTWSREEGKPSGALFASEKPESGTLWAIRKTRLDPGGSEEIGHYLLGFGEDDAGEVYVLTTDNTGPSGTTGKVFKIVPAGQESPVTPVTIRNFAFTPNDLTVPVGATVTWTNEDTAPHTATSGTPGSPDGIFDSGTLSKGQSFRFTFAKAGTVRYFCGIHPNMTATVTVK